MRGSLNQRLLLDGRVYIYYDLLLLDLLLVDAVVITAAAGFLLQALLPVVSGVTQSPIRMLLAQSSNLTCCVLVIPSISRRCDEASKPVPHWLGIVRSVHLIAEPRASFSARFARGLSRNQGQNN